VRKKRACPASSPDAKIPDIELDLAVVRRPAAGSHLFMLNDAGCLGSFGSRGCRIRYLMSDVLPTASCNHEELQFV